MGSDGDYTHEDLVKALRSVGVKKGDSLFVHSNLGFFGKLKGAKGKDEYYRSFKKALFEVLGDEGTLVVPTFSYSFCWGHKFDVRSTPSVCGFFSEAVRVDPSALRSNDPNFSVAALGKKAELFTKAPPEHSFGPGSFWERFLDAKGKVCNFNFDSASTLIHYVEKVLAVPYRYDKSFKGTMIVDGKEVQRTFVHFVFDMEKSKDAPEFPKFDKKAKEVGLVKVADLGRGQVVLITAKDTYDLVVKELRTDPWFLRKGS